MSKNLDHDDLGIDLEHAKTLPICDACRKQSDGSVKCSDGTILCGAHYDEWMCRGIGGGTAADFAKELREGRYKPCWEAKIDE